MSSCTGTAERLSRAGVLVPWANTAVEAELHRVTGTAVTWHYSRLVPESPTTGLDGRFLTGLEHDLGRPVISSNLAIGRHALREGA